MSKLAAVKDDKSDHLNDPLKNSQTTVFAEGKEIIVQDDRSETGDAQGHTPFNIAQDASGTVFISGKPIHRKDDLRNCGAKTIVTGQSTVFVG
jgi:uncharacterized Zn-binding protein involved in type VI secretion